MTSSLSLTPHFYRRSIDLAAILICLLSLLALAPALAQASTLTSQVGGQTTGASSSNFSLFSGGTAFTTTFNSSGSGSISVSTVNASTGAVGAVSGEPTSISSNVESDALSPNGLLLAVTFQATATQNGSVGGDPAYSGGQQTAIIFKVNQTSGILTQSVSGTACSTTNSGAQYSSVNVTDSALEVSNAGQVGVACDNTENQFGDNPPLSQQYFQIYNTSGSGLASGGSTNLNPSSAQGSTPILSNLVVSSDGTTAAGLTDTLTNPVGNGNVTQSSGLQTFALTTSSVSAGAVLSQPGLGGQASGSEYAVASPISFGPSNEIAAEVAPVANSSNSQPGIDLFTSASGKYSSAGITADPQLASILTTVFFSPDSSTLLAESVPTAGGDPSAIAFATGGKASTLTSISCTTGVIAQTAWVQNQSSESFLAQDSTSNTLTLQTYSPSCSSSSAYSIPPSSPTTVYASAGSEAGSGAVPVTASIPVSLPIETNSTRSTKVVVVDFSGLSSKTSTYVAADKPLFAFDSARLSTKARVELAPLRQHLAHLPKHEILKRVVITGFAADGTSKFARFSRHLGFERAKAVEHFLFGSHEQRGAVVIARSGARALIFPKHLGKITHQQLASQFALERRVEIQITVSR